MFRIIGLLCFAFVTVSYTNPLSATLQNQNTVGQVSFKNSGNEDAQRPFLRGLALLHNFEYEAAAEAFIQAQKSDPNFAMAYWGEAMTFNQTVWMGQDKTAALEALSKLDKTSKARMAKTPTEREKAYLSAVETLYGEGNKKANDFAYADKMKAIMEKWPDDIDARALRALSILGTAHDGREFAIYMKAAALLEEVFPENKSHPGVLHYLIHSYDDAIHSPLGLRAAKLYGKVAPNAGHALHMTSHIFLGMGMWEDVVAANKQAVKVVNRQRAAKRLPSNSCGHYVEWLTYAWQQQDKTDLSDALIAKCRILAEFEAKNKPHEKPEESYWTMVYSHSIISVARVADTGAWANPTPITLPEGKYLKSHLLRSYGNVLASRQDADAMGHSYRNLQKGVNDLYQARADEKESSEDIEGYWNVILTQASGLIKLANGDKSGGIADLQKAAQMESNRPLEFGPPDIAKPSWELLGEELERLERYNEALAAYKTALSLAPGRRLLLEGITRLSGR